MAKVEIFYFEGCPHVEETRQRVKHAARQADVNVDIELVHVVGACDAVEKRFMGSPSVRIDGRDVEGLESDDYSMRCRIYALDGRIEGAPSIGLIASALSGAVNIPTRTSATGGCCPGGASDG